MQDNSQTSRAAGALRCIASMPETLASQHTQTASPDGSSSSGRVVAIQAPPGTPVSQPVAGQGVFRAGLRLLSQPPIAVQDFPDDTTISAKNKLTG